MGSKATTKTSSKEVKAAKAKKDSGEVKSAKSASEKERAGWKFELLREPLIDKALEDNGLDTTGKLAEKAERLDSHYRNTIPTEFGAFCECGFYSDQKLPACPFCGDAEIVERDIGAFGKGETPWTGNAKPANTAIIETTGSEIVEASATSEDRNASVEKLALLDEAVENVKRAHVAGIGSYWDLGRALIPIHEKQLYFQRLDAHGAPKYKSWSQFLAAEFGGQITDGHSYRVMGVARKFDRETAIAIGVAKLAILERAKDEALPKLLEAAREQTVKELAKTAAPFLHEPGAARLSAGAPVRKGRGTSAGSRAAREEGRAQASFIAEKTGGTRITVSTALGETIVPLFQKADMKVRATVLRHEPVGVETFTNGVEARYFVELHGDGGMQLKIVRTRAKS